MGVVVAPRRALADSRDVVVVSLEAVMPRMVASDAAARE
jgi:hypothetical protein